MLADIAERGAMAGLGLRGKVAVITGSSKGWGMGCAEALAAQGAKVVINGTIAQDVDKVVGQVRSGGGEAVGIAASVATMEGARRIIGAAMENFGRLDVLVNNAGGIRSATIADMTEDEWDSVIGVQLKGVFNCTSVAVKQMLKQGQGGRIINMAGAAGVRGMYANANHAASKGAVLAATFSWSLELERYGITVNAVRAAVRTKTSVPLIGQVREQLAALGRRGLETDRELGFFEPGEAAPIVAWLASDDAGDVTGQFIGIDGPKLVLWSLAQPQRTLYMFPQWSPELIHEHFKPVFAESAQRSLGVLEVVPFLGHLTPELQQRVEKGAARKTAK